MNLEFKESVVKTGFRPTDLAYELEDVLRSKLGFTNRYDSARLLIGRSLREPEPPKPLAQQSKTTKIIPGEHLFGDDIDLWISMFVIAGNIKSVTTSEVFKTLVEAHWARGAVLIKQELNDVNGDDVRLAISLSGLLPERTSHVGGRGIGMANDPTGGLPAKEVRINVGPVSKLFDNDEPIQLILNGPNTSPHIALMGGSGKGKTTTGIQMAKQILEQTKSSFIFIDNKGEFVEDGKLVGALSDLNGSVEAIEVGTKPIPLDFLPHSSAGDMDLTVAAGRLRDAIILTCSSAGPQQQSDLLDAIISVSSKPTGRDLNAVKQKYETILQENNKKVDTVLSRLKEVTVLKCFTSDYTPEDFYSKSWVISLRKLPEETKKLITLLLLESISANILSKDDAPISDGFRKIRQVVVIDEARKILKNSKNDALVDIITKSRSKGASVMLLSQDPSDFEGQEYDFMTQIGAVVAFACNQSKGGLKALEGVFGRKVQTREFADTYLEQGVAFCKLPGRQAERIRCWSSHK
jgi:DNA sulfur modification protein DndE